jgi:hypothetical protein
MHLSVHRSNIDVPQVPSRDMRHQRLDREAKLDRRRPWGEQRLGRKRACHLGKRYGTVAEVDFEPKVKDFDFFFQLEPATIDVAVLIAVDVKQSQCSR